MKLLSALLAIGSAFAQLSPRISVENGVTIATFSAGSGANHAFSGAPYAAKESYDSQKNLPDGGHVKVATTVTSIWQDSAGRKRFDRQYIAPNGLVTISQILDPVDGAIYILDPAANIVHRFKATFKVMPVLTSAVPTSGPPRTTQNPSGSTFTVESIGTRVIGGITAYGTRTTTHYPAGSSAGNDQAFDSVTEHWNSPQIASNLLFKTQDPRFGDSTIKLENVVLGEPDSVLLRPPSAYRVVDETGTIQIKVK